MRHRSEADKAIDNAHNVICCAEMLIENAQTEEQKKEANDKLARARRCLTQAVSARRKWNLEMQKEHEAATFFS